MKFSKDYSKLDKLIFTTIRKGSNYYRIHSICKIKTPTREFKAMIVAKETIEKEDITEELAQSDADCSKVELIAMLEKWYGKEFDDFVLLTLQQEGE
jgi:hypothetical protein